MSNLQGIRELDGEPAAPFRIRFKHRTCYQYSGPVEFLSHRLVLRPRESHFERLEGFKITTLPSSTLRWSQDVFGNIIAQADFAESAAALTIESEFVIAKSATSTMVESHPIAEGVEFPVYYAGIEEAAVSLYRSSVYPPEVESVRRWVREVAVLPPPGQRGRIFESLATAIHERVEYRRREESGVQSPAETLALKSGSCRDTAVLLMEAARSLGFAARFVSGYMESENSKVACGSTHAWAEVYCPDRGWLGFDPSLGQPVGLGHVAVGVSHHPRGVMPVSGTFKTNGNVATGLTVSIASERQAAPGNAFLTPS